jgi:hypothetical protein
MSRPAAHDFRRPALELLERVISFPVCAVVGFAVFVYLLIPQSVADPDIWWHLRNADWQLHAHAFLTRDYFSFTVCGAPWIDHEWLSELPLYLAWRILGATGLFLMTVAAVETVFAGVFYLSYRKSGSWVAALAASATAALLSTVSFSPRTLLFGWILLVAELLVLERFQTRDGPLYPLPLLFAVWINAHGSWLIGAVVLGVFIAGGWFGIRAGAIRNPHWKPAQRRQLLIAGACSAAALFVNPYGWRLVRYPFDMALRQRLNIATIDEWRTLDFHSPRGRIFFGMLAVFLLLQLLRRRRWTLYELGLAGLGVYAAVTYSRFLFLAGILALPLLAPLLARARSTIRKTKADKPWANAILLLMLGTVIARHLPIAARLQSSGQESYPLHSAAYLRQWHPRGNVFNDYLWGGFLIWNYPQVPVFIDSRVDIFEYRGVFRDYLDAIQLKNTLSILDKYHIRYVVFRKDQPIVYLLEHTPGWKVDFEDATTAVLDRR